MICATLSKEQGITVLAVCLTIELCKLIKSRKIFIKNIFKMIFILNFAIVILALRIHIMGGTEHLPVFTKFDNPTSFLPFKLRLINYNYLVVFNTMLLLFPSSLCCDWTMKSIKLIESVLDMKILFIITFYAILLYLIYLSIRQLINRDHRLLIAFSMMIIPFIPASNLFFPVGFVIAERTLYIPSAGFCMIISLGFEKINKSSKLITYLLCITLFAFSLKTQSRNFDWLNELNLFSSGIKVNSNNAKLYNNIGHYYEKQKDYGKAIKYFNLGLKYQPDDLGSSINIARTLINMEQYERAEHLLWKLKPRVKLSAINKRIIPNYLNLWINLGNIISRNTSRLDEAEMVSFKMFILNLKVYQIFYVNLISGINLISV